MGQTDQYDVIVIGVGGMGSSTVYHLAKRGMNVLGIEKFDIPHTRGSSHGDTRVFRLTQTAHPDYVPLAQRARELWRELESESGEEILTTTGTIHAGPEGSSKFVDSLKSLKEHGVRHEVLTGSEINERFPGYELPEDYQGVYQSDGGFLASVQAITTHVKEAQRAGGIVHAREEVVDWKPSGNGVVVKTDRGTYEADHLVVTAGAWAGKNLEFLSDSLKPERRVMAWLQPNEPSKFQPDNFPAFSITVPEGNYYGFPVYERPGFKFGRSSEITERIDPDNWQNEPTLQDEELLRMLPKNHFPDAVGPTLRLSSCIVTRSVDGHFYLDKHPEYPQVSIGAGFTGHGYKFCSVIGETLADFAVDGDSENAIDLFRFDGRI